MPYRRLLHPLKLAGVRPPGGGPGLPRGVQQAAGLVGVRAVDERLTTQRLPLFPPPRPRLMGWPHKWEQRQNPLYTSVPQALCLRNLKKLGSSRKSTPKQPPHFAKQQATNKDDSLLVRFCHPPRAYGYGSGERAMGLPGIVLLLELLANGSTRQKGHNESPHSHFYRFSRKHGEGFSRWVHGSYHYKSHCKELSSSESLHRVIIIMAVSAQSHCTESFAQSHLAESLHGVIAQRVTCEEQCS